LPQTFFSPSSNPLFPPDGLHALNLKGRSTPPCCDLTNSRHLNIKFSPVYYGHLSPPNPSLSCESPIWFELELDFVPPSGLRGLSLLRLTLVSPGTPFRCLLGLGHLNRLFPLCRALLGRLYSSLPQSFLVAGGDCVGYPFKIDRASPTLPVFPLHDLAHIPFLRL